VAADANEAAGLNDTRPRGATSRDSACKVVRGDLKAGVEVETMGVGSVRPDP
jgi:hypothetical protein